MSQNIITETLKINGAKISLEVGNFAEQATAAVLVRSGGTVVHVTIVKSKKPTDLNYLPLFVEYKEKLYASGIIKGSRWVKREGKPSDEAILKARLIDRSARPLFDKDYRHEIQLIATVLSFDNKYDADLLALYGASTALAMSKLPWQGPIGAVRIGLDKNQEIIINPTKLQQKNSDLDLVVSGSEKAIIMVEAEANEISETKMLEALQKAHVQIKKITTVINKLVKKVGVENYIAPQTILNKDLKKEILTVCKKDIDKLVKNLENKADPKNLDDIIDIVLESEQFDEKHADFIKQTINEYFKQLIRQKVFNKDIRVDGRKLDEIRNLTSKIGVLPQPHGSAMFQRGGTQALTVVTLASPQKELIIEDLEGESTKRYIHHYYFPPYCVGETGRMGWPSRREIGHGFLAERGLLPVIPSIEEFPYTIRVVSQIMSSNGSSSMASVCGSTLSLMDAGVPIKKHVAGIAMGLMAELNKDKSIKNYKILTDIQGLEDHIGDMDFKVVGTKDGITALQMDIKITGISFTILKQAMDQAKKARLEIIDSMIKTISKPRDQVSETAPKIDTINISKEKIGEIIGPGGRTIREITKETNCQIDVDDNGKVIVSGQNKQELNKAINWIDSLTRDIKAGEEYEGKVTRIENYGAFIEILPGRNGLLHISKISSDYVKDINDVISLGETIRVKVKEIDDRGRVDLVRS